ncbi:MAG: hypothetical protein FWE50_01250 [Alphaproteobacteria bacterium]|nr:hypothetical protein [Alphaproteobacteria bacterium]
MKNFKNYALILFASLIMSGCADLCKNLDTSIKVEEEAYNDYKESYEMLMGEKAATNNPRMIQFYDGQAKNAEFQMKQARENIRAFKKTKKDCNCK